MGIKIFCDSADLKIIKKYAKNSIVKGFTTNPSLMRLSKAKNYKKYSIRLLSICAGKPISEHDKLPKNLSAEQFSMLQSWHDDPFNWGNKKGFVDKTD